MQFNSFEIFKRDLRDFDDFVIWTHQQAPCSNNLSAVARTQLGKRFNPLTDLTEKQFRLKYRYTKENMRRIIELVRDDLEADYSRETRANQVPVEFQIMAAIRYWCLTEHPEHTASVHNVSQRTLAKICKRVAIALASKASRYIRMPATLAEKERVTNEFYELAHMPHIIGAIAHANVRLRLRQPTAYEQDMEDLINNATEMHMQVQTVSDASFKIRDLDCRLRPFLENNYASEMFMQTRIKERFEQNEFRGRVLLGDGGLPCTSYLFTPVQCPTTRLEQTFNRSHAATFAPVITCFTLWRRRFGILDSEICATYGNARHTVVSLALLHNMAIEWNDPSLDCSYDGAAVGNYSTISDALNRNSSANKNTDTVARLEFIKHNF